jgi:hypothetical protein
MLLGLIIMFHALLRGAGETRPAKHVAGIVPASPCIESE